ncbi:MAG: nucleotidyltransferase family protein [Bacteroidaceae bacterium]|nr:nucleotidyltransferase family protein [Bacteroidaceae bacterium]
MSLKVQSYLDFVRYCIGAQPCIPSITDWNGLFVFMQEQALLGVGFKGLKKITEAGMRVPKEVLLRWFAVSEQISGRNEVMNGRCVELTEMLRQAGFECCILKGQGNALMYPAPELRASGDIDAWLNGAREEVMAFVRKKFPSTYLRYHHVEYPIFADSPVELHFMPASMNNPMYNKRLQRWFEERKAEQMQHCVQLPQGIGSIPVPTLEFNVVFQLTHMMHHFFDEGIGLRQMMDYYYLLRKAKDELIIENEKWKMTLRHLGLWQFAGAVMYVMREVFHLEEEYMIAPVDERRGWTLMKEILKGGNFGQYSGLTAHGMAAKYFLKIQRNMRFVWQYPAEALCEPIFRTWHFFWRACKT